MQKINKKKILKITSCKPIFEIQNSEEAKCIWAISLLNEKLMERVKHVTTKLSNHSSFTIFASKPFLQQNKWLNKKVSKKSKSDAVVSESDFLA